MSVGCLLIGMLFALISAAASLVTGAGFLAAFGFYVLGGILGTLSMACIIAVTPKADAAPPQGVAAKA